MNREDKSGISEIDDGMRLGVQGANHESSRVNLQKLNLAT